MSGKSAGMDKSAAITGLKKDIADLKDEKTCDEALGTAEKAESKTEGTNGKNTTTTITLQRYISNNWKAALRKPPSKEPGEWRTEAS